MPAPDWNSTYWVGPDYYGDLLYEIFGVDGYTPKTFADSGSPFYGSSDAYPTGGWQVGFRPSSVTVDMTLHPDTVADFYEGGDASVTVHFAGPPYSVKAPLYGATFPLEISLAGIDEDITSLSFIYYHGDGQPGTVNSVVFAESGCNLFWMNHKAQYEVCE